MFVELHYLHYLHYLFPQKSLHLGVYQKSLHLGVYKVTEKTFQEMYINVGMANREK